MTRPACQLKQPLNNHWITPPSATVTSINYLGITSYTSSPLIISLVSQHPDNLTLYKWWPHDGHWLVQSLLPQLSPCSTPQEFLHIFTNHKFSLTKKMQIPCFLSPSFYSLTAVITLDRVKRILRKEVTQTVCHCGNDPPTNGMTKTEQNLFTSFSVSSHEGNIHLARQDADGVQEIPGKKFTCIFKLNSVPKLPRKIYTVKPALSSQSWEKCRMAFEDRRLLNTYQFTIKMNSWDC